MFSKALLLPFHTRITSLMCADRPTLLRQFALWRPLGLFLRPAQACDAAKLLQKPEFLLADDPSAGKTIMTGLLPKELKYRGLVQRTLIVMPGHLEDQWRREMKERFHETFTVVDRSVINASWGRNIWEESK